MMSPDELLSWYQRLDISQAARVEINRIRSAGPCRRVGGGRSNVIGRYPTRKMGATVQFESHQVELAFVREMEHDPAVLEFYDQPPSIPLDYESAKGRRLRLIHTPDFFVLRSAGAGWEECKTEEDLHRLAERVPTATVGTTEKGTLPCLGCTIGFGRRLRSTGWYNAISNS